MKIKNVDGTKVSKWLQEREHRNVALLEDNNVAKYFRIGGNKYVPYEFEIFARESFVLLSIQDVPYVPRIVNIRCEQHYNNQSGFIVMKKYHELQPIISSITNQGQLQELFKKLFIQMILTIQALQDKFIKHGDIKPDNLMVDDDHNLKLIDFSNMIPYNFSKDKSKLSRDWASCTLNFRAPEYCDNTYINVNDPGHSIVSCERYYSLKLSKHDREFSRKKTDIYSLALTFIEMYKPRVYMQSYGPQRVLPTHERISELLREVFNEWGESNDSNEIEKEQLIDLFQHMLSYSTIDRYDIDQVINHPFIQESCQDLIKLYSFKYDEKSLLNPNYFDKWREVFMKQLNNSIVVDTIEQSIINNASAKINIPPQCTIHDLCTSLTFVHERFRNFTHE